MKGKNMSKKKCLRVLWASKHQMGVAQKRSLFDALPDNCTPVLEERTLIWESSVDEAADNVANISLWEDLARDFDIVCGVFPPSAIIALLMARGEADEEGNEAMAQLTVFTPIANIASFAGTKQFTFLRWQEI